MKRGRDVIGCEERTMDWNGTWGRRGVYVFYNFSWKWLYFFFFQAEDGIRDIGVTGVQTCALPISNRFKQK